MTDVVVIGGSGLTRPKLVHKLRQRATSFSGGLSDVTSVAVR